MKPDGHKLLNAEKKAPHKRQPYMMRLVAVGVLLVTSCGPLRKGPKGISAPVYDALDKAASALARANEYRDAGVLLYEPRFLEVERAVDEVKRQVHNSKLTDVDAVNETGVWMMCDRCVSSLKSYRLASRHLDRYDPPSPDAVQSVLDAGKTIDSCLNEADAVLR